MKYRTTFYLRSPNDERPTPIICFVHFRSYQMKLSTGLSIEPKHWDPEKQRPKRGAPLEAPIRDRLHTIELTVANVITKMLNNGIDVTPQKVRERYVAVMAPVAAGAPENLLTHYQQFIEGMRSTVQPKTILSYEATLKVLKDFATENRMRLAFDRLDARFFERLRVYLAQKMQSGSAWCHAKNFKVFLRSAERDGIHNNTAFHDFKIIKREPDIIALSREELAAIQRLDLSGNEKLARTRDLFVLACYTGLRHSDLIALEPQNIVGDSLQIVTKKTRQQLTIPLLDEAKRILDHYSGWAPVEKISSMNVRLKKIAQLAGINQLIEIGAEKAGERIRIVVPKWKAISSHSARRSFITLSLEAGMRSEIVMRISGHRSYKSFARYVALTDRTVAAELREAWGEDGKSNTAV